MELTSKNIRLGAVAKDKADAIRQAGQVLVEAGNIAPGYIESMFGREEQANTYLGNGIAIPHGMPKDRELIHQTGISVVQFPDGVQWKAGQMVYLVVGIAARSDEHLAVLAALTDVLDDSNTAQQLAKTSRFDDIIAALKRSDQSSNESTSIQSDAPFVEVALMEGAGLHARPATYFVQVAGEFKSEIGVSFGGKNANGKAMASLLKLGVPGGETIRISASGPDAKEALIALKTAVESGLGDEEEHASDAPQPIWTPVSNGHILSGVSASPGLAIGSLHQYTTSQIIVKDESDNPESEKASLTRALEVANEQLEDIYHDVTSRGGRGEAAIFRAHKAFLDDPDLIAETDACIKAGHSAAWSWQTAIEARVADMRAVGNERLAERAVDMHDVGQRVLRVLVPPTQQSSAPQLPNYPVILVADDLTPSDTARLDPKKVLGLCTALGGPTSHTAIIARSLDIPAIVGVGAAVLEQASGSICILDGSAGRLFTAPDEADFASAREFQNDLRIQRDQEYETRYEPALLRDGKRIEITANVGQASEAEIAVDAGAEGVGLLRTEFLFLGRETAPTEDEQFAAYSEMTRALNGLPLIIRTLDIGGDKVVPYIDLPHEDNPFLGVRGIRLCLRKPELFIPQLRAIYRAAQTGPVKIMFPMIATLEDLRAAKAMAEQVRFELNAPVVEIGIMVEVPATAVMAREFAEEADFFSVGTNDLTQYALAIDRLHPVLGKQADALHPAVLRLIDMTVRAADEAGKWVGVCGGIAGDPLGAAILSGLGVTELSMSAPSIAAVKARLRRMSGVQAKNLATRALRCKTAEEVRALALPA